MAEPRWNLLKALNLYRRIHPVVFKAGYNLHIGGGVLNRGFSHKDLDLVALRRPQIPKTEPDHIEIAMRKFGYRFERSFYIPHRFVMVFFPKSGATTAWGRVDFIILDLPGGGLLEHSGSEPTPDPEWDTNKLRELTEYAQAEERRTVWE